MEMTLAEFLGWEENVEYRRGGNTFKVDGVHLMDLRSNGYWGNTCCDTWELIDLRDAVKVKPKKYYLRHRFLGSEGFNYLNYRSDSGEFCLLGPSESYAYKTKFTDKEIEEIEASGFDLSNFGRIEVEED